MEVQAIRNADSYSVLVDNKILCHMASGGVQRFRTKLQAEVEGRSYARGNIGGAFLSEDIENYLTN